MKKKLLLGIATAAALAALVPAAGLAAGADPVAAVSADLTTIQTDLGTLTADIRANAPKATLQADRQKLRADAVQLQADLKAVRDAKAGAGLKPVLQSARGPLTTAALALLDALRTKLALG